MSIVNIVKEPEYYYPAGMAEQDGLMTYQEYQKLDSIPTPSNIVTKSSTAGLLKNDGTVDSNSYVKKSDIETEKTATGNPITLTDAIAGNAIEVSAEIVASQDLHGYDKPWVGGAGANMLHLLTPTEGWSDTVNGITVVTPSSGNVYKDLFYGTLEEGKYTVKDFTGGSNTTHQIACFKNDNVFAYIGEGSQTFTVTSTSDTYRIRVYVYSGNTATTIKPICCKGESISAYSPYENICPITGFSSVTITDVDAESHTATVTVSLGSTVYGGTLDLTSGVLTITHANIASYNGETIGEPWISSLDEYTEGETPTTGAQVVYTLATPTTTTLTAAQLALVKGYNQLTCNSGDMEITYKASSLDAWKERVNELDNRVDELEDAVEDIEDRVDDVETALAGKANVEPYLEQSVTLSTSQTTTVTFTDSAFTANSVVDPAISVWGIFPEDVTVANGSCTVVMPKVSSAQTVTVGIFIKR